MVASAVAFGLMPTFAHWARRDMELEVMLALRFGLAALVLSGMMVAWKLPVPRGRVLAGLIAIGAVGYVAQSMCYFAALGRAPTGLVALLFYLYPVTVTVLAWALFRERLSTGRVVGLLLAMLGLLFLLAPLATRTTLGATASGILLALASGVIYAFYVLAGSRVMARTGAIQASAVICASAAAVLGLIAAARQSDFPTEPRAWGGLLALTLVSTVGALTCFLAGLSLVGPVRASTISALEPAVAVAAGAAFLGESVTGWAMVGGVLIIAAAIITSREARALPPGGPGRRPARG